MKKRYTKQEEQQIADYILAYSNFLFREQSFEEYTENHLKCKTEESKMLLEIFANLFLENIVYIKENIPDNIRAKVENFDKSPFKLTKMDNLESKLRQVISKLNK